jgi:hypothetical protein
MIFAAGGRLFQADVSIIQWYSRTCRSAFRTSLGRYVRCLPDTGDGTPADTERQIEQECRRTAEAHRQAAAYRHESAQLRSEIAGRQAERISTAADAAKLEVETAKRDFDDSMNTGDFARSAEAQARIADATLRAQRLEEYNNYLQTAPQQTQPADPVEAFAQGRTEASAAWIRQHPDFVRDQRKFEKLQAAHHDALAHDLVPDTSAYFEHVERRIGLRKPAPAYDPNDPRTHLRGREMRLTAGEVEAATGGAVVWNRSDAARGRCRPDEVGSAIGVKEFARRKRQMMADGYYDRSD